MVTFTYEILNGKLHFLCSVKYAHVTPFSKEGCENLKENHRQVSVLPLISKTTEKLIGKQLTMILETVLLKFE